MGAAPNGSGNPIGSRLSAVFAHVALAPSSSSDPRPIHALQVRRPAPSLATPRPTRSRPPCDTARSPPPSRPGTSSHASLRHCADDARASPPTAGPGALPRRRTRRRRRVARTRSRGPTRAPPPPVSPPPPTGSVCVIRRSLSLRCSACRSRTTSRRGSRVSSVVRSVVVPTIGLPMLVCLG